ncbi:hypothetical protein D7294_21540 [Streptomyces hoynatensis]|uniref:Integral membrane protein n=1 Tax=Streptomyces hoynatensis TaxID=1141874 RepID=A0A3A9YTB5_9ACTN|nr:hypothetical protein D7294_21540 [Streptomyces hoynatensis]
MPRLARLAPAAAGGGLLGLALGLCLATGAHADETDPPADPDATQPPDRNNDGANDCELISGGARDLCEGGDSGGDGGGLPDADPSLDPLSSLAKGCADAAAWIVNELSDLVESTTNVDFTNASFLRQYAVVFAASTVLTLILWLLAIVKRAIRGVPLTTALTEAVGFLWLTVMASAFTPLILYVVVSATDGMTQGIVAGTGDNSEAFFGDFAAALEAGEDIGGGPIMLIVVSLISILAAGVLALELVIRAAMLYVGALLGTAVYAGLVDKNLWSHVRRWAGIMIAVILIKPVIVIVLGLAAALTTGEDDGPTAVSAVVSGLAIIILAIFASAMIYRFVPGFGDEIVSQRAMRQDTSTRAASAALSTPANLLRQGMSTHGARDASAGPAAAAGAATGQGAARPANPLAQGVAAHGTRGADSTSSSTTGSTNRTGNRGGSGPASSQGGSR